MSDPRTDNCKSFVLDNYGLVTGVALEVRPMPSALYELVRVELIDEYAAQGNTVATCSVLDPTGIATAERVYLAWPWPSLTTTALAGNPNGQHMIGSKYNPPDVGPLALYVGNANAEPISDIVGGLGLPFGHHISFRATWRVRGAGQPEPEGPDTGPVDATVVALERIADALERLVAHLGAG